MRVLVISDVHANLNAIEAVLAEAGPVDEIWSLGDLVGYGPDPNAVVELFRSLPDTTCLPEGRRHPEKKGSRPCGTAS